jgi:hypothetical protein
LGALWRVLPRSTNIRKDESAAKGFLFGKNMKPYQQKLLDPRWQQMRLRVYERDNFKCKICGDSKSTLNAHHVHYHPSSDGPWDYDMRTIITLCAKCHEEEHETLNFSKASLLLAIAAKGYTTSSEIDCLTTIFDCVSMDDLNKFFKEMQHGKNQNG